MMRLFWLLLGVLAIHHSGDESDLCARCGESDSSEVCRQCRGNEGIPIDSIRIETSGSVPEGVEDMTASSTCTEAAPGNSEKEKCMHSKCNVWIGGKSYCSQCSMASECIINGQCHRLFVPQICKPRHNGADGTCESCGVGYFLYKNGCYRTNTDVGLLICTDTTINSAGVCIKCAAGYFNNPAPPTPDKPPCIACNETSSVDRYEGISNCAACIAPNPNTTETVAKCTSCFDGFYGINDCSKKCDESCKACASGGKADCTLCNSDKRLQRKPGSQTGTCVDACEGTYFLLENENMCYLCSDINKGGIEGCETCTPISGQPGSPAVKCTGCVDGKKPGPDGSKCVACNIEGCANCSEDGSCMKCNEGKYLSLAKECVADCKSLGNYYDENGECKPCDNSCASCSGAANKCASCPAGKRLSYDNEDKPEVGTCVDGCKPGGAFGCRECGAKIEGTAYCSRCSGGLVPLNGVCVANAARTRFCEEVTDGSCNKCANGYFIQTGGCYQADRFPGKSICTEISNDGKCKTCANGLSANDLGACPSCDSSCETCSKASDPNACIKCATGYYMSGGDCVKCTNNSNGIIGVKDCTSCDPPASGQGSVICYVSDAGKSGLLSSQAMAGLSAASIIVTGGLAGFLCWWFIYHRRSGSH